MKSFLLILLGCLANVALAQQPMLEGFEYGNAAAPTGNEWQSPEQLGYNKLQPRAGFVSFATSEEARHLLPEFSSRQMSLDGTWKFHFAKNPDERPTDFFQPDFDCSEWDEIPVPSSWNIVGIERGKWNEEKEQWEGRYGVPIYVNQPVIFYHQVQKDDWRKGVMREPPKFWTTYEFRNEVGSYRRTFNIPKTWKGQEIFVEFDGVDSFFYLWINGQYVGFSKNSRDAARFDITRHVRVGDNSISVEVYRNSDGSFLEAQDMFRLPGIFRSVSVYATPKVHIQDFIANAQWKQGRGSLHVETAIEDLSGKRSKGYNVAYKLYKNKLYSDENELVAEFSEAHPQLPNVETWSAEEPNVYVLVAELKDKKGRVVEAVSSQIGFRTVEIKDVPASEDEFQLAGRYFLVNGKPLKLKGVNRHETNPATGHAISRQQMEEEIMMMKRANINHVRTSHYSNDPYFYYLCNKYGIYLEAEANLESHEYYYGEASLSHPQEWRAAHIARMMELAHARVNDPSIVIWSLGNEAGPGDNFRASYAAVKAFDPTRPVQYERNNNIVDMGSNQYPSVNWVRQAVKGNMNIKYPFHISEYAHSMGNAVGNLQDYWDAIESTNFFCGGAIWDWIDQSMYNYTRDHQRYLAYGGDFGDTPNDREFVMNGIIFGDMEPKPQYYEVKKVYQNVGVKWDDVSSATIDIFNKNYYTDNLTDYDLRWTLTADGREVETGTEELGAVAPRSHKIISIPRVAQLAKQDDKEYLLNICFQLKEDKPWAKAGFVQAEEQLPVRAAQQRPTLGSGGMRNEGEMTMEESALSAIVKGDGFCIEFDKQHGCIQHLEYKGQTIFENGNGPQLDAYRAPVNNDNWADRAWRDNGLNRLEHQVTDYTVQNDRKDGTVVMAFNIRSAASATNPLISNTPRPTSNTQHPSPSTQFAFNHTDVYTIYPDGSIEVETAITSNNPSLVLPRLGFAMTLPKQLGQFCYYGRGPVDNYPDRKRSQNIGLYESTVQKEFENFPKPQDMANHQDTRWCALTSKNGAGALFVAAQRMSVSALPWTAQQLEAAPHPYELPASNGNHLHLDMGITGLGGNSCGQGGPLEPDRVKASAHTFGFAIRPIENMNQASDRANISLNGQTPLLITRDAEGNVSITSAKNSQGVYQDIYYVVSTKNKKAKPVRYTGAFNLRDGGIVTAYEQSNPKLTFSQQFERIESIPVQVMFASSVESGEGDADHLVDGNPSTYWHTMWSVTVANYPHWVDFDCQTTKNIKGFTYLPRQDSNNGNIRNYRIQVSQDGKTWSSAIHEGQFENNRNEKRVIFDKPVRARYLRFTALSSQDGQDFATGAEFTILED